MVLAAVSLASLVSGAWGHGFMISPVPRQHGAGTFETAGTACGYCSCCWYQNSVEIKGEPTYCDAALATTGNPTPCAGSWTNTKPWRAPGTAPIGSPCGSNGGTDGASLPPVEVSKWSLGSIVEIAHAITANHGGGYSY